MLGQEMIGEVIASTDNSGISSDRSGKGTSGVHQVAIDKEEVTTSDMGVGKAEKQDKRIVVD